MLCYQLLGEHTIRLRLQARGVKEIAPDRPQLSTLPFNLSRR